MNQNFFKNLSAIAVGEEQKHIYVAYSAEKLQVAKEQFFEKSREMAVTELEAAAEKKVWSDKLKKLKEEKELMMQSISAGGEQKLERLLLVPDYEKLVMERYFENGELFDTRRMTQEERQVHAGNYIAMNKSGTEG
jgi:hypothetical protein